MTGEVVATGRPTEVLKGDRALQIPLVVDGRRADPGRSPHAQLERARAHHRDVMATLPAVGRKLSRGEPAIDTDFVPR
jgi:hypothetical protein